VKHRKLYSIKGRIVLLVEQSEYAQVRYAKLDLQRKYLAFPLPVFAAGKRWAYAAFGCLSASSLSMR
jgi:hypothetical protein